MRDKLIRLGLIAIGIFLMVKGVNDLLDTRASAFWPSTEGQITYSQLVTPSDKPMGLGFIANVEYRYVVEGGQFTGNRISFSDAYTNNEEYHQEMVDKYFPGKIVDVFYKPSNPSESVLEKRFTIGSVVLTFLGIACFVLGIVIGKFRRQRG